jgi:hypothetical protein
MYPNERRFFPVLLLGRKTVAEGGKEVRRQKEAEGGRRRQKEAEGGRRRQKRAEVK